MAEGIWGDWLEVDSDAGDSELTNFDGALCCDVYEPGACFRTEGIPGWQYQYRQDPCCRAVGQERISVAGLLACAAEQPSGPAQGANLVSAVAQALEERNQRLNMPSARFLDLNSNVPGTVSGSVLQEPFTPTKFHPAATAPTAQSLQQVQDQNSRNTQKEVQQWLARQEASLFVKSASAGTHNSRHSSSASSTSTHSNPAGEMMQLLPPPAFAIMGLLG